MIVNVCAAQQHIADAATPTVIHGYELTVKDAKGRAIKNAKASFVVKVEGQSALPQLECVTDEGGTCRIDFEVIQNPIYRVKSYDSSVTYSVSKPDFYNESGQLSSFYGSQNKPTDYPVRETVILYGPVYYLAPTFAASTIDREIRDRTIELISLIRLQSLEVNADLIRGAVTLSTFRNRRYLQFKINTTSTFNSLRLDKYGVAKKIFDDSIRKILNPLNEYTVSSKLIYGFDLVVLGYVKNFADKDEEREQIQYRFLIPQDSVRRYKEKDISGQQLLDAAIILMNDERIELKLQ